MYIYKESRDEIQRQEKFHMSVMALKVSPWIHCGMMTGGSISRDACLQNWVDGFIFFLFFYLSFKRITERKKFCSKRSRAQLVNWCSMNLMEITAKFIMRPDTDSQFTISSCVPLRRDKPRQDYIYTYSVE